MQAYYWLRYLGAYNQAIPIIIRTVANSHPLPMEKLRFGIFPYEVKAFNWRSLKSDFDFRFARYAILDNPAEAVVESVSPVRPLLQDVEPTREARTVQARVEYSIAPPLLGGKGMGIRFPKLVGRGAALVIDRNKKENPAEHNWGVALNKSDPYVDRYIMRRMQE
jgi:hypothetical protein